eukprot:11928966-Karenia_brevis.AAC.1
MKDCKNHMKITENYTLTAKDPKQQGLKGLWECTPGNLESRGYRFGIWKPTLCESALWDSTLWESTLWDSGSILSRATDFESGDPYSG